VKMLSVGREEMATRVEEFAKKLEEELGRISDLKFEISDGLSAVGGGAAPAVQLQTRVLALSHSKMKAPRLEQLLRNSEPPVIARIVDNRVTLDFRTIADADEKELLRAIASLASESR